VSVPETWIRTRLPPPSHIPTRSVIVWVRLSQMSCFLIWEDGTSSVRHTDWDTFGFKTRPLEMTNEKGIVRVA
jgi:hypothetical protein